MSNKEITEKIAAYIESQEWGGKLLDYVNSIDIPDVIRFKDIRDYVSRMIGSKTDRDYLKFKMQCIVAFPFAFIKPAEGSEFWRKIDKDYESWLTLIIIQL